MKLREAHIDIPLSRRIRTCMEVESTLKGVSSAILRADTSTQVFLLPVLAYKWSWVLMGIQIDVNKEFFSKIIDDIASENVTSKYFVCRD